MMIGIRTKANSGVIIKTSTTEKTILPKNSNMGRISFTAIQPNMDLVDKFPLDTEYKKSLAKSYNIKNPEILKPIMGIQELKYTLRTLKETNYDSGFVRPYKSKNPKQIKNGIYRANLHCHSNNSGDGTASVEEILNQAATLADNNYEILKKQSKNGQNAPFIIAITDHNTTDQCDEVINQLKGNPKKYRNLKILLGSEIETEQDGDIPKAHILVYGFNPQDKKLTEELPNSKKFSDIVEHLSGLKYGAMGIAHPQRMIGGKFKDLTENEQQKGSENYFGGILKEFKTHGKEKATFVENYYQSYYENNPTLKTAIKSASDNLKFISTGGIDSHANNIFTNTYDLSPNEITNLLN